MNVEARPWLVDFHAAAALDSVPVFWVFLLGLFLVFSAFRGLGFYPWAFSGVFCILRSGLGCFLPGRAGLGVLPAFHSSFFFVLPTPPTQSWATWSG